VPQWRVSIEPGAVNGAPTQTSPNTVTGRGTHRPPEPPDVARTGFPALPHAPARPRRRCDRTLDAPVRAESGCRPVRDSREREGNGFDRVLHTPAHTENRLACVLHTPAHTLLARTIATDARQHVPADRWRALGGEDRAHTKRAVIAALSNTCRVFDRRY
jgi:hypothetical protein